MMCKYYLIDTLCGNEMETRAECPIVAKMLIFGEHPDITFISIQGFYVIMMKFKVLELLSQLKMYIDSFF